MVMVSMKFAAEPEPFDASGMSVLPNSRPLSSAAVAVAISRPLPTGQATELGLALAARGCAQALSGQGEQARGTLADAQARLASALPEGHPLRLRPAAMSGLVDNAATAQATVQRYLQTLAPDSPLRDAVPRDCRGLI